MSLIQKLLRRKRMKKMHVPQSSHTPWIFLIETWIWFSDWQARLLVSPIVHARTNTIFKVMKVTGIPHCDGSPNYFWNELCGSMEIFANLHFLSYSKRITRSCVDEPKCNSQLLTMVTQMKCLFFFFHIIQNKFRTRLVPCIMHEPWQSLQFCMNFNHLGVVSILYYKHIHLIIHFNPDATWLFLCTFFFSLPFNILTEMSLASRSIYVWQQYITDSIFRLHFKNLFGNTFCNLHITMNSASKAIHASTCGVQGIAMTIFSASCRRPAQPRRSTIQV